MKRSSFTFLIIFFFAAELSASPCNRRLAEQYAERLNGTKVIDREATVYILRAAETSQLPRKVRSILRSLKKQGEDWDCLDFEYGEEVFKLIKRGFSCSLIDPSISMYSVENLGQIYEASVRFRFFNLRSALVGIGNFQIIGRQPLLRLHSINVESHYQQLGLGSQLIKVLGDASPAGTRLNFTSNNSQTNEKLNEWVIEILDSKTYDDYLGHSFSRAERFLNAELNRRAASEGRVLWFDILSRNGWENIQIRRDPEDDRTFEFYAQKH